MNGLTCAAPVAGGLVAGSVSGAVPAPGTSSDLLSAVLCPDVTAAARLMAGGGLVVYPTETFFGLGCRADAPDAVLRIFAAKRRKADMPLPVIIASAEQLPLVAAPGPNIADDLADLAAFWPGPVTLLLPARAGLPEALTGGTGRIALRVSSHPAARALAEACAFPVVSSSANISGRPAVTSAAELDPELLSFLRPGLDGVLAPPAPSPAPGGGLASTIVEPLGSRRLLVRREGALPLPRLSEAGFSLTFPH